MTDGTLLTHLRGETILSMQELLILARVFDDMLRSCRKAHPHEACGLLGGRPAFGRRLAVSHYPVANVADDPERTFVMEPTGQLAALDLIERRGERPIAVYHSHPRTSPIPSAADIRAAHDFEAYYIIIGLSTPTPKVRVYRLFSQLGRAVEVRWRLYLDR